MTSYLEQLISLDRFNHRDLLLILHGKRSVIENVNILELGNLKTTIDWIIANILENIPATMGDKLTIINILEQMTEYYGGLIDYLYSNASAPGYNPIIAQIIANFYTYLEDSTFIELAKQNVGKLTSFRFVPLDQIDNYSNMVLDPLNIISHELIITSCTDYYITFGKQRSTEICIVWQHNDQPHPLGFYCDNWSINIQQNQTTMPTMKTHVLAQIVIRKTGQVILDTRIFRELNLMPNGSTYQVAYQEFQKLENV